MKPHDTTDTSRAALVARIARNDEAMTDLQAEIDRTYSMIGSTGMLAWRYERMDGLHTHGLNLRADLRELDAAAAAPPVMVQQQCQQQQADASRPTGGHVCEACGRPLTDPYSVKAGIGPVCRAHGHTKRQLHFDDFLAGADFESELIGDVLCLIDLDQGGPTITNGVQGVIQDLIYQKFDLDHLSLIYRDSSGRWDEILVKDGQFAGFRPIGVRHRCEALEIIAKRRIQAAPVTVMSLTDFLAAGASAFHEVARIETDQDGRIAKVEFPR